MYKKYNIEISPIIEKIKHYCMLQDRCELDVIIKMNEYKLPKIYQDNIIKNLTNERYINEDTFCSSFCRGKFRINKWGRIKIANALKKKKISESSIKKGMQEIDQNEYINVLDSLLIKKNKELNNTNIKKRKIKIANFLIQKGFESFLVWEILQKIEDS